MENDQTTTAGEVDPKAPGGKTEAPAKKPRKPRPNSRKTPRKTPGKKVEGSNAKPQAKKPWPKLVVLFRHGVAEESTPEKVDAERSLTTAGHDRTKRAARGLAKVVSKVDCIYASPLLRSLQTALWLTKAFGGKVKVQPTELLKPESTPDAMRSLVTGAYGRTIVLVGHEPGLTRFLAELLGGAISANLRRAGCIGVRIDEEGRGTLEWMMMPRTLRDL